MVFSFRHKILSNSFDHVTLAHILGCFTFRLVCIWTFCFRRRVFLNLLHKLQCLEFLGCQQQKYAGGSWSLVQEVITFIIQTLNSSHGSDLISGDFSAVRNCALGHFECRFGTCGSESWIYEPGVYGWKYSKFGYRSKITLLIPSYPGKFNPWSHHSRESRARSISHIHFL